MNRYWIFGVRKDGTVLAHGRKPDNPTYLDVSRDFATLDEAVAFAKAAHAPYRIHTLAESDQ